MDKSPSNFHFTPSFHFPSFHFQIPYEMARATSEIPGPPIYPLVGSIPSMAPFGDLDMMQRLQMARNLYDKYGTICKMKFPVFNGISVFLFDPADFEKVYR